MAKTASRWFSGNVRKSSISGSSGGAARALAFWSSVRISGSTGSSKSSVRTFSSSSCLTFSSSSRLFIACRTCLFGFVFLFGFGCCGCIGRCCLLLLLNAVFRLGPSFAPSASIGIARVLGIRRSTVENRQNRRKNGTINATEEGYLGCSREAETYGRYN